MAERAPLRYAAKMSQLAGVKCLDKYGFPLAGLTAAEQAVRTEAAARETKLHDRWARQVEPSLMFSDPIVSCAMGGSS